MPQDAPSGDAAPAGDTDAAADTAPATPDDTLAADLDLLATETDSLLRTIESFRDDDLRAPSGCEGWTRGHVVTHLARNAESLVRLVLWARTGVRTPQYPSRESRDADIEAGSGRPADVQADDVKQTADLLRDALAVLALPLKAPQIELGSGPAPALALPRRRLNEVVLHHHDLRAGWSLPDAHPLAVADLLDLAVERIDRELAGGPATAAEESGAPGAELLSDEGDRYVVGAGGPRVTGSAAALLAWLARQDASGVRSDGPLPRLP